MFLSAFAAFNHAVADDVFDKNYTNIVFIPKAGDQDFWKFMRNGADKAVSENKNVRMTWRGPAYNDDTDSQIRIAEAYSVPSVNAIIIAPTDAERLSPVIKKAHEKGTPVIIVDSGISCSCYLNYIATDNREAGRLAARHLSRLLDGKGNVVLFRTVKGSASTDERGEGFIEQLKKSSPDIKIIADIHGGGSRGKSLRSARDILKENPKIDGIFAVNESASDGMARALIEHPLKNKPVFIGFDATPFLIDGIRNGLLEGIIVQDPRKMGYLAVKSAIDAANKKPPTEKTIHTDSVMITNKTLDNPEIKALLIP